MRAVILAAGVGRRLGHDKPKILLEFGGCTLLERHLAILAALDVRDVVIGIGYEALAIERALGALGQTDVSTIYNPDYEQGSILTLWCVREALTAGGPVLLMDGDVLYDRRVLAPLVETHYADCLLVDRAFEPGDEPVKVGVVDGAPADFGKTIDPALEAYGESVGFFRLSDRTAKALVETAGRMIEQGGSERPMEDAVAAVLRAASPPFGFEDVTGLPWIEIDFPEDVARAETEILPNLADEDR
ncbi:MAG: phosphocholine cytidylyltransferase family protein [Rhodospirillales bacterium]|nr:phosphocholine cytidylyltransferase family protein [Rhodospirillales bacterium]